jgi:uracil-DNA glycosylase family 4
VEGELVLREVAGEVRQCMKCDLANSRKNAVPGEGPANASIMFIGEGPGFYENEQGRPFVGQAGKFLDELLESAGLHRENVYITNVVKCRPPGNRDPQDGELAACAPFLERQIEAINPLIIVTLGRFSMARYFQNAKISVIHGRSAWMDGRLIVPMYHPAAGLHQAKLRPVIMKDFAQLPKMVDNARQQREIKASQNGSTSNGQSEDATQLSFF